MKRFLVSFFCLSLLLAVLVGMSPSASSIGWKWSAFDGQDIALKLATSGLLVWLLAPRSRAFNPWNPTFWFGILLGSVGLFILQNFYSGGRLVLGLHILGTSIPELGTVLFKTTALNPLFASALIPFVLLSCLSSHPWLKWGAFGIAIGMAAFMIVTAFSSPTVALFGRGLFAQVFLLANAAICALCARLFMQADD